MKKIGLLNAILSTRRVNKMTPAQRKEIQDKRLVSLVMYAKAHSPYFGELYRNVPDNFTLSDLPVTNKQELMEQFDTWMTDRTVTLQKLNDFMKNLDNIGRKMDGKYLVYTTSGSTGNPAVVLYDDTAMNVSIAVGISRSYARKEDLKNFIKKGGRSVGLFADNGFYLGCGSIHYNLKRMPWKKKQLLAYDVRNTLPDIVETLNRFQPVMLGSYSSALELLIEEQRSGRLHISPVIIMSGGEYLSDSVRKQLTETFHCYVQTNYSCTEGGTMACECTEKHFHLNDDWVILEAVDGNNCLVPFGTQSAKLLLTNLSNFVQPFIRYEITDRATLHNEPCACGKDSVWLELEGRTDDILEFNNGSRIAPLSLYAILKEIHFIKRFQLIEHRDCSLELRLTADNKAEVFKQASEVLKKYLMENGVETDIYLSEEEPQADRNSGKFKHVYRCAE